MQSVPGSFWQWVTSLPSDDLCGLVAIISVFSAAAIIAICITVYMIHRSRAENALKRELLDRGMSADEIATVVKAKPESQPLPRSRWR